MDSHFEDLFDPNNKFHVRWLKDIVNNKDGALRHNPFGVPVGEGDMYIQTDVVNKLCRKFVNSSVSNNFGDLFTYEYGYQMEGEYQKCRLLRSLNGFPKGAYFEYVLVYPNTIDFYDTDDDAEPVFSIQRW